LVSSKYTELRVNCLLVVHLHIGLSLFSLSLTKFNFVASSYHWNLIIGGRMILNGTTQSLFFT
jgi:hypothetical protein